jgi:protein SCO1
MKVFLLKMKWFSLILVLAMIMTGCGQGEIKDARDWPVNDFRYTDQNGESFGLKDLEGKVWVADFIFTSCETVCSPMTYNMEKLQQMTKKEGIENIEFVSFSVDPTVDTPEKLKEYGEKFNADFSNWQFLTGYEQAEIENLALKSFKALVKKPQEGDQVIHGTDFYLVGPDGKVLKYYTGLNEIPYEEILSDIKTLQ